jgi:hypothetical protein
LLRLSTTRLISAESVDDEHEPPFAKTAECLIGCGLEGDERGLKAMSEETNIFSQKKKPAGDVNLLPW